MKKIIQGAFLAAFAGCCWGSMGVACQYLFTHCQFTSQDLTSLRLMGAGVLLLLLMSIFGKRNIFKIFADRRNLVDIFVYGIGVLLIQYTFLAAIETSNAGTAAIMVCVGPLMIIFYFALAKKRKPTFRELMCLCLAVTGVTLIATKGNFSTLDLSYKGVCWGLASAAFGSFCTVQPKAMIERVGVSLVVGWGMFIGGAVACCLSSPFTMNVIWSPTAILCYIWIIFFGTVVAFWCYLKSTEYVIASISAILASFEPFTAVLLSVILLGATFNSYELLGAAAIIANMVIVSWPTHAETLSAESPKNHSPE